MKDSAEAREKEVIAWSKMHPTAQLARVVSGGMESCGCLCLVLIAFLLLANKEGVFLIIDYLIGR